MAVSFFLFDIDMCWGFLLLSSLFLFVVVVFCFVLFFRTGNRFEGCHLGASDRMCHISARNDGVVSEHTD